MPGRVFLDHTADAIASALGLDAFPDLQPRSDIAPGANLHVLTPGREIADMRWGIVPVGRKNARGRPVLETLVNLRGETVFEKGAFDGFQRAVVPVSGWYEWTGKTGRKTRWRIARADGAPVLFAAMFDVWTAPGGRMLPQVATVTCPPSGDLRDIHDRMGVILSPDTVAVWLDGTVTEAQALIQPVPDGMLQIAKSADGKR